MDGGKRHTIPSIKLTQKQHQIQSVYSAHREARNRQQRQNFLSADFKEVITDSILLRLENPSLEPGFRDDRHCLTFWARPPDHVLKLASRLQYLLKEAAPNLWLMPPHRMHMTALEISHSKMPSEITCLVNILKDTIPAIMNMPATPGMRSRLVKPMLTYDLAAVAVSFVPAAGEVITSPAAVPETTEEYNSQIAGERLRRRPEEDAYTYHHLRRDLFKVTEKAGVDIVSRYVVPSAHITLARFLGQDDHSTEALRTAWIKKIDDINRWLESEVWDRVGGEYVGEWCVGQERGLEARTGAVWYGGGRSIMMGEGF